MATPVIGNVLLILFCLSVSFLSLSAKYSPTWESLDSRPNPAWYDEAKLGIFIHWGLFSVPSFKSEWFWWDWQGAKSKDCVDFMKANYRPDFTYADFSSQYTAELYDSDQWAEIFNASGAKYIVLTSKHHEGFTNWPSNYSWNWNSKDTGPNRDLVGELATSIRKKTDIHFGLYHSMYEWFHPLYLQDKADKFQTDNFVKYKTLPELYEIVNTHKPEVVWSDGDWEAPDTYWQSKEFMAWLYNDSPVKDTVITNDRWGSGCACHHGGVYTCTDRYNPKKLQEHKFENAMTIDKLSWGYRRNTSFSDFLTIEELIATFAETISCGGNMLMNIGPTSDGSIIPIFQQRLLQMGTWLKVNGEAVYSSKPWKYQNDTITPNVWYTKKLSGTAKPLVYAILLEWPANGEIILGAPVGGPGTTVELIGYRGEALKWKTGMGGIVVGLPISFSEMPCQWAWVLRFTDLQNA